MAYRPANPSLRDIVKQAPVLLTIMLATYLVNVSLQSVSPIITLYVKSMNIVNHAEIISGLIFASSALGSMFAAPILGRLGDRVGHHKVLLGSVLLLAVLNIPQALVHDPWSLLGIRFLSGLCVGGLMPSISALLRRMSPASVQGSVFGYNSSATSFGNVCGSFLGGVVSNYLGIGSVFYFVAGMLLVFFMLMLPQLKALDRNVRYSSESRGEKMGLD
ncbi:MFS transporter [Paenibacillus cremeus]|uniref:Multidrug efflux MFS transporter n=1 Tax=Paenibacillus cremeus TaxID=2163881 RepID=A0A559KAN0_9BACL|nr:MFS transporter [Paenibacillus cremeus]TVY09182.1 multidrug efflux MFS transporter [Paenibacillus cremeus]